MKVLLTHNYYGSSSPSGENQVFKAERDLLRNRGHELFEFIRHSDEIRSKGVTGIMLGALSTPWNPWSAKEMRRAVDFYRPDIVHAHNTFPLLSPSIFHAVGERTARVVTLHNYRLLCPAAIPMRKGRVCTECLEQQSIFPSLRHGCYRGSRLATLPLAINVALHRAVGTWAHQVDAFIALTEFQKEWMVKGGLPPERIYIKPNFFEGCPQALPWSSRDDAVVFAGRLSEEKGIQHLIKAWLAWGTSAPELRILGDGPLRGELISLAQTRRDIRISFLGQVSADESALHIARARLVILPSICFEGFPMVVREAFAFGTPVAVSDLGALPFIVNDGVSGTVFPAADADALYRVVRSIWSSGSLEELGKGARTEYELHYNEDVNYAALMDIYDRAMMHRRSRH